ncbi:MAG: VacJ family lipoprotein [Rhodobacteraceae bacterium]|nr:VacJ family lipoprotein [Paracoccaceae bacterium]
MARKWRNGWLVLALVALVSACSNAPQMSTINDPHEAMNRRTHDLNKSLDRNILKPLSSGYGKVTAGPVSTGISNFASNLSLPGKVVNDLLQLDVADAFQNTARFVMNSTIGLAGLLDVATQNGLDEQYTDFGETLHVWGFHEGSYLELPVLGPSTERDAAGVIVDFVMDPLNFVVPSPERYWGTAAKLLNKVGDRGRYSDLVDSVLYDSEDSYAQSRLLYLQSRRHDLYGQLNDDDLEDPYAE